MIYFAAACGILFSSFWIAQLIFVKMHKNWTDKLLESDERDENTGVSIIHPIKGMDFELDENLETWMSQNYRGPVQHIFSFQEQDDPAIEAVKRLQFKHPDVDIEIAVNPVIQGLN